MSEATQYDATHARWKRDPEAYWAEAARGIDWDRAPQRIFDAAMGVYGRWFPDAALNTCHNAVDRHVAAGRGQQDAIIYDSPMTGQVQRITYAELQNRVAKLAGALAARGITKGDRVVIYMPMVPEAAIAMLATARLGAVHSVVFGGFAAAELASRIADAKPKAIISASCGLEPGRVVHYKPLLDEAIALSPHKPSSVLILQRPQAPLLAGCTTVLFEGKPVGTPDPGTFWRVCADHGVKILFTAPTAIRAIKKEDPEGVFLKKYDLSKLEALYLAGERCDPDTILWSERLLQKPVVDHWWQTETGWTITGNFRGLGLFPTRAGSGGKPAPGYDVVVLDEAGQPVPRGQIGSLAVKLPLPPSALPTLYQADERFKEAYLSHFAGHYSTADAGMIDAEGYVSVMSRTDDIINVAGHRLSTGAMEEVLAAHPDIAECAVVGVRDTLKGQVPLGLVVVKSGVNKPEDALARELIGLVREKIGPVAAFKDAKVVARLPKTRSGKILRATMRKIADAEPYTVPPTIDDPAILEEITVVLKGAMR